MVIFKRFRITHLKHKLIAFGGYCLLLLVYRIFKLPCIFLEILNVPCPGCGMTRAFNAAMQLDIAGAFSYHMMFWSVPLIIIYLFIDAPVISKRADRIILSFIGAGFLINWIFAIINHCFA